MVALREHAKIEPGSHRLFITLPQRGTCIDPYETLYCFHEVIHRPRQCSSPAGSKVRARPGPRFRQPSRLPEPKRSTLLIDADLRRSRCHEALMVDKDVGLSEVLSGRCEAADAIRFIEDRNLLSAERRFASWRIPPSF